MLKALLLKPRLLLELLMVVSIIITGWLYNRKTQELLDAKAQYGQLAESLKEQITIRNNQIEILRRGKDGTVQRELVYLPPEGWYRFITPLDGSAPVIKIKDKGFTCRPGFGGAYGSYGFSGILDLKLAYFKRYSAGVNANTHMAGVFVSRHLDDIIWGHPANAEVFIGYGLLRGAGVQPISAGVRSNF